MRGLCQRCYLSNVEIAITDGVTLCQACAKKKA